MVFIGAALLPHGPMILDPTMEEAPSGVDELHTAAKFAGDYIRDHEPDIVVLATPHGLNISDSIGIYASSVAAGSAEFNRHWREYKVSVNLNEDFATEIYEHLQVYI
jgi:aromatic ring-opening dioxygenase LigB subunit